jgi:PDZ domain-containing protein
VNSVPLAAREPALVIEHWRSGARPLFCQERGTLRPPGRPTPLDLEEIMKKMLAVSALGILALAVSAPAFAGGGHCSGSAASADAGYSCSGHATKSAAWAGAWLQRSASGTVTVAEVAKGSPAAKAGLKSGDVVVAVNGYDLSDREARTTCASKADCSVGSTVTYTVLRTGKTKNVKLKLEKMPADATERFASHQADFDPALAAVVMPTAN